MMHLPQLHAGTLQAEGNHLRKLLVGAAAVIAGYASSVAISQHARADDVKSADSVGIYAKIVLPMKPVSAGTGPVVESWIAKKLRKRGNAELRAVTEWIRLPEKGERFVHVWDANVDGSIWGCPVAGRIVKRTADGTVTVRLAGWSPVALETEEWTMPAEMGSRRIIVVETGAAAGSGRAYVALFAGPAPTEAESHGKP